MCIPTRSLSAENTELQFPRDMTHASLLPIGSVKDAVNRKITLEELIALAEARSEGNLARLMILNCSSRPLQENLLSQWTGGQKNIYPDTIFEAIKLLKMQDSFTGRKKKIEDREEDKDNKGASANTCNRNPSLTRFIF